MYVASERKLNHMYVHVCFVVGSFFLRHAYVPQIHGYDGRRRGEALL